MELEHTLCSRPLLYTFDVNMRQTILRWISRRIALE